MPKAAPDTSNRFRPRPASFLIAWTTGRVFPSKGFSPAISSSKRQPHGARVHRRHRTPQSTTTFRLLFSSIGIPHCFQCGNDSRSRRPIKRAHPKALPEGELDIMAPIVCADGRRSRTAQALAKTACPGSIDGVLHNLGRADRTGYKKKINRLKSASKSPDVKKDSRNASRRHRAAIKLPRASYLSTVVESASSSLFGKDGLRSIAAWQFPLSEPLTFLLQQYLRLLTKCATAWA